MTLRPKSRFRPNTTYSFSCIPYVFITHLHRVGAEFHLTPRDGGCDIEVEKYPKRPRFRSIKRKPKKGRILNYRKGQEVVVPVVPEDHPVFKRLDALRQKFARKGRALTLRCEVLKKPIPIEYCVQKCKSSCDCLDFEKLKGPKDDKASFVDDYLNLQRLINLVYGGIKDKSLEDGVEEDEPKRRTRRR